jgi:hypothetical protein
MLLIQYEKCQNKVNFEENTRFTWEFVLFLKFCRDIVLFKTHKKYFANCYNQVTITMVNVKVVIRITYWRWYIWGN